MDKQNLKVEDEFIVRYSARRYEEYDLLKKITKEDDLYKYYIESNFSKHLITLSYSLYNSLIDNINEKQAESILKYMIRSCVRTTPFGMAAGIGLGKFTDCEQKDNILTEKYLKPDFDWLFSIIESIKKELGDNLFIKKSNTFIDFKTSIISNWNTEQLTKGIVTLDKTSVVEFVLTNTDDLISIKELKSKILIEFGDVPNNILSSFIDTLIRSGVLISDLDLSLTSINYFDKLLEKLERYDYKSLSILHSIKNDLRIIVDSKQFEIEYNKLIEKMKSLQIANQYIHTDMYTNNIFCLNKNEKIKIENFARFLLSNSYKSNKFEEFINHFEEFYGNGVAVKIHDLFNHPEINNYIAKSNNNKDRMKINQNLLNAIISSQGKKVELSDYLNDEGLEPIDYDTGELGFFVLNSNNSKKYLVSPFMGTNTGMSSLGRFSYLFGGKDKIKLKTFQNEVDISFLPKDKILGNVLYHEETGEMTLNYGCYTESCSKEITLDNIYIFTYNKNIYFIDASLNKIIDFYSTSRTNINYYPDVLRFLIEATVEKYNNIVSLYECITELTQGVNHIPRICWKDFILLGETWNYQCDEVNSFNVFQKKIDDFRIKNNLGKEFFCEIADNRLLINIENIMMYQILYNEFKKTHKLTLTENLFSDKSLYSDENGDHYVLEYIFQVYNDSIKAQTPPSLKYASNIVIKNNTYLPFDQWLSFKVYAKKENFNKILLKYISPFIEKMYNNGIIDKYFFIRYIDTGEHLRIRIKILNYAKLLEEWKFLIELLKSDPLINDVIISPYRREYYRYGENYIDVIESLFDYDSSYAMEMIKNIDKLDINRKCVAYVLLIEKIILYLEYDEKDAENLLQYFKNKNKTFVQDLYKQYKDVFVDQTLRTYALTGLNSNVYALQNNYIENIKLLKALKSHIEKNDFENTLLSIFHMSFNRMIGINRELENKCMSLVECVLYKYFGRKKHLKK